MTPAIGTDTTVRVHQRSSSDRKDAAAASAPSNGTQASDGVPPELEPLQIHPGPADDSPTRTPRTTFCDAARNFFFGSPCRGGVTGGLVAGGLSAAVETAAFTAARMDIVGGLAGMAGPTVVVAGCGGMAGAAYAERLRQRRATI